MSQLLEAKGWWVEEAGGKTEEIGFGAVLGTRKLTSGPESAPLALPAVASLSRPGPAREIPAVIPPFLGLFGLWLRIVSQIIHVHAER